MSFSFAPSLTTTLILFTTFIVLADTSWAFGAGDIPDFAYLNDKAFRHGDIENVLGELVKGAAHASGGAEGLLDFAKKVIRTASGGKKFSKSDIQKVYFGNWLRDYSQAMDIAGLSKLSADTLVLVVSVLGFMTFGYTTNEYEITHDRLGVYLPVEHIDNPKGYAEKEGDARQFHPNLRPPVDERELEIDERTGMKKYMATEDEGFDSSTALLRRTFRECIELGRRSRGKEGPDLYEAYRLMGTGLHTLEDLLAHSNWCEIALRKMGHSEVFCHVGDDVEIDTPNGRAPPLVTGTFGSADFIHSVMGEATDKLSQASVTALSEKMSQSSQDPAAEKLSALKNIFGKLPIGGDDDKMQHGQELEEQSKAYHFDPDNVASPEVQKQLLDALKWRDEIMRDIEKRLEMVPGLSDLLEELSNALNAYIYTVIAPWLTPILEQAVTTLAQGSKAVIDQDDQYEVFNNPNASDPSHSMLSKDHFGLILNEPAGKIAKVVVVHTVNLLVNAWNHHNDPDSVIEEILEAFHHPYYNTGSSTIQSQMFETLEQWFGDLGPDEGAATIQALTKESVKDHKNKRLGGEGQDLEEPGYGHSHSHGGGGGYKSQSSGEGGYQQQQQSYSGGGGDSSYGGNEQPPYSSGQTEQSSYSIGRTDQPSYSSGGNDESFYSSGRNDNYGSGRTEYGSGGNNESSYSSSRGDDSGYGGRRRDEDSSYSSSRNDDYSSGRNEGYGGSRHDESSGGRHDEYGSGRTEGYGRTEESSYSSGGRRGHDDESYSGANHGDAYGSRGGYGRGYAEVGRGGAEGYGRQESHGGGGYGREESYGGRNHGGDDTFGAERLHISDEGYGGQRQEYGGHSAGYGGGDDEDRRSDDGYSRSENESNY